MSRTFVIGNEKGGAGKTTCAMHLISGLLEYGYNIASIDVDIRQLSLTSYIQNRVKYNQSNPDCTVRMPEHFYFSDLNKDMNELQSILELKICEMQSNFDYLVIDTPGYRSPISDIAHSYADVIITPMNDSFVDLDVLAKVEGQDFKITRPSIYSQMVWEQKMQRLSRDKKSIEWIVIRNRLSNVEATNKRNVGMVLDKLKDRIGINKIAPGFTERVIFRELFLQGLTLSDLNKQTTHYKSMSMSHVAARQELRDFISALGISAKS